MARTNPEGARERRRERVAVVVGAFVLATAPFARSLFVGDRVSFAVDGATAHLPWAAHLEPRPVANPELADQGVQFYPFYRWVSRSWLAGDPPWWCPLVYAGAPGLGNAQAGVLDPQVGFLVLCEALGGRALFDLGLSWMAALRLFIALTGGWALARRLGLGRSGAALVSIAFAFSGFQVLWLNHALGHVPPFLPWILYFLEGIPGPRPGRAVAGAALSLWLAILGGHVETAFYVGLASGVWALALGCRDRRVGGLALAALALGAGGAAPLLLATHEYLGLSAARYVRELAAQASRQTLDPSALGVLLLAVGVGVAYRRSLEGASGPRVRRSRILGGVGFGLAVWGAAAFLAARGLGLPARLALVPDLFGSPASGGYRGGGTFIENASAWVPAPVLLLALASLVTPGAGLPRGGAIRALGGLAFLLAIQTPGVLEAYRFLPLVGLEATVRAAPVAALMLALLAGEGLRRAPAAARGAALLALAGPWIATWRDAGPPPLPSNAVQEPDADELFGMALVPEGPQDGRDVRLEGWVSRAVPFDRARLVLERIGGAERFELPLQLADGPSPEVRGGIAAPPDARWFRYRGGDTGVLADGHWTLTVEFLREGTPEPLGRRHAGILTVHRGIDHRPLTWILVGLGGFAVAILRGRRERVGVALLVLAQALAFAHGVNPQVPRERVFPQTRTEAFLAEALGPFRFFSDADVLPPNTGLVQGLRGIQGYDAIDPLAFNLYRENVLLGGTNALLAWTPRGVDLDHPAFRLYGVRFLVLSSPLEHRGWRLVASPDPQAGVRAAETWIYEAVDPAPRAFCVSRVVDPEGFAELYRRDPAGLDPLKVASIREPWRPKRPFETAEVSDLEIRNSSVRLRVRLDGDGLLVLTEQAFPGWRAEVDGRPVPVYTADELFRSIPLTAGDHEVRLHYEPAGLRVGGWIALVCALSLVGLATAARRWIGGGTLGRR